MNLRTLTYYCVAIASIVLLSSGGCSCSSKPHEGRPQVNNQLTTGGAGATAQKEEPGQIPPTIFTREWHPDKASTDAAPISNDLKIRTYGDDEVLCVGKARSPIVRSIEGRSVAMMAFTCSKPGCAAKGTHGRPLLFTRNPEEYFVSSEGRVMQPRAGGAEDIDAKIEWGPPLCPSCGKNHNTIPYVLPEVKPELSRLEAELERSRRALKAARANGGDLPPGIRPPTVIFDEISALPQLYLVRQTPPEPLPVPKLPAGAAQQ